MINSLLKTLFGDPSDKKLKQYENALLDIKKIEERFASEINTLEEVHTKTAELKSRFA